MAMRATVTTTAALYEGPLVSDNGSEVVLDDERTGTRVTLPRTLTTRITVASDR